jgi:hypothetical protein
MFVTSSEYRGSDYGAHLYPSNEVLLVGRGRMINALTLPTTPTQTTPDKLPVG